jgi:hypothetical protein
MQRKTRAGSKMYWRNQIPLVLLVDLDLDDEEEDEDENEKLSKR